MTPVRTDKHHSELRLHKPLTRMLHWSVFILVLIAAGSIITRAYIDSSMERKLLLTIHQSTGLAILGLTLVRLAWRHIARVGALHVQLPRAVRVGSSAAHAALYIALFALTILGWLTSSAFGQRLRLGAIALPALIGRDRDLGDNFQAWHADLAWILLILVLGHVGAALWHRFQCRDGVLRSMAPFRVRTKTAVDASTNDSGANAHTWRQDPFSP
jgi:cytochrome b561